MDECKTKETIDLSFIAIILVQSNINIRDNIIIFFYNKRIFEKFVMSLKSSSDAS